MERTEQIKKNIGVLGSEVRYNIYSTNEHNVYEVVKVQKKEELVSEFMTVDEAYEDHVPNYVRNAIRSHYFNKGMGRIE
ncbi:hypothetical protein [Niallia taxi]|uniref:hypothetical protein n=1 Tax=Niallia taxi TaxID=2499688 RepID=UPI0015F667EA|nr:hypothetical protein [Niallia taxi]